MSAVKIAETKLEAEKAEDLARLRKAIREVVETSGEPYSIAKYLRARGIIQ